MLDNVKDIKKKFILSVCPLMDPYSHQGCAHTSIHYSETHFKRVHYKTWRQLWTVAAARRSASFCCIWLNTVWISESNKMSSMEALEAWIEKLKVQNSNTGMFMVDKKKKRAATKRIPGVSLRGKATALVSVRVSRFLLAVRTESCWKPWQVPQIGK